MNIKFFWTLQNNLVFLLALDFVTTTFFKSRKRNGLLSVSRYMNGIVFIQNRTSEKEVNRELSMHPVQWSNDFIDKTYSLRLPLISTSMKIVI